MENIYEYIIIKFWWNEFCLFYDQNWFVKGESEAGWACGIGET